MIIKQLSKTILWIFILCILLILISEGFLRMASVMPELIYGKKDYGAVWRQKGLGQGGLLEENFDGFLLGGDGARIHWKNNAQGFRNDTNTQSYPNPGVRRLLFLGDSFIIGYRLPREDTFAALIEKSYDQKQDGHSYEALIASIEDPVTAAYYLSQYGKTFHPDIVILGITLGNDIVQSYFRLEPQGRYILDDKTGQITPSQRFQKDWKEEIKNYPFPEEDLNKIGFLQLLQKNSFLYRSIKTNLARNNKTYQGEAISSWYRFRVPPKSFDISNGLGVYLKNSPLEIHQSYKDLSRALKALKSISDQLNIKLVILLLPQRFQVQAEDWQATVKDYQLKEDHFNLMKPNHFILSFCQENHMTCIDPTPTMTQMYRQNQKSLYFPNGDMHMNALGNKAVYTALREELYKMMLQNKSTPNDHS